MRKEDIDQTIRRFLSRDISLDEFRQWFAEAYVEVRQDPTSSREASQLCSQIVGPLAEFSRGHRSEGFIAGSTGTPRQHTAFVEVDIIHVIGSHRKGWKPRLQLLVLIVFG
jgi:hypothetical protein